MFKNILLPYDFENDFSAIPDYLEKVTDEDSVVVIYHVVTENDLAISVKYYNKHKKDIIREKEKKLTPFLRELEKRDIQYKIDVDFGHIKDTILEKITSGDINNGEFD
ncbi:universal stress protein, partial [Staphylococcus epidermidis]